MRNARKQAEGYVLLLDTEHKAPPFIIVCDVGHCFVLYAEFTGKKSRALLARVHRLYVYRTGSSSPKKGEVACLLSAKNAAQ